MALLGEASGENEQRDELPFRPWAPAGALLERTLRRLGYSRDQFSIANSIFCKPPGNELLGASYELSAIEHCKPNVRAFLAKFKPRVVVALGAIAFRTLTGISGTQRGIGHSRGYVFPALPQFSIAADHDPDTAPLLVIPTYHPSFLRRGAIHLTGVFARDMQRAVNVAAGRDQSYILEPLPDLSSDSSPDTVAPWEPDYKEPDPEVVKQRVEDWLARHNFRYLLHPTLADLDLFCRDVKARSDAWLALSPAERDTSLIALSHDIETYESASLDEDESDGFTDTQVRLSQFSIEPGQAIAMPWRGEFIQATRWLLKLPLPKVGQNYWYFDQRVLRAVGRRDFGDDAYFRAAGTIYDTLQQFHYFEPDLPAHLQYAASYVQFPLPWKHLSGENLELYGCFDTDAAIRIFYMTRRTMQDRGIWTDPVAGRAAAGYLNMVQAVRPILAAMEDRGLPINDARRLALGVEFDKVRQELFVELDGRFPDEARKLTPKEGYKGVPAAVKLLLESLEPTASIVDGMLPVGANGKPLTKTARAKLVKESLEARWENITADEMVAIRAARYFDPPEKQDDGTEEPGDSYYFDVRRFGRQDMGGGLLTDGEGRWCRVYQFSPNSSPQLMNYMRARRHKVPVDKKRKSETTSKHELVRLAAKHHDDFYLKTIECREMGKMSSTYIDGYKPAADGRVHPTFTFATSTGQLAARAPNCFSEDTEYLTQRGWVFVGDLREDDLVAEWKWLDGSDAPQVRFSVPLAYIRQQFEGQLLRIQTEKQIDLLVTEDHGCLLRNRRTAETRRVPARDYPEDWMQMQAGVYVGGSVSWILAQVVLICALQADGSVNPPKIDSKGRLRGKGGQYDFGFTKARKAKRFAWALAELGIVHHHALRKTGQHRFYIARRDIPVWWQNKKQFGAWLLDLDRHTLDMLAEELWFWDGCLKLRSMFSSSIKRNTDWAQIVTILSNRRAKVRLYAGEGTRNDNWQVDAASNNYSMTTNREITKVGYSGYVHCVTMPWSSVVVRRNGKVAFTGQSQNFPSHGKLGKAVKSMIEAPEGFELGNWDYKSFHVVLTGFLAEDPSYIRMARLDMHSFITWHFCKLSGAATLIELSDEDLLEKFAWLKKDEKYKRIRDKQSKPSILGIALGLQPPHLYDMNREHFDSLAQTKQFRSLIEGLFPKVFRWQNKVCEEAHQRQVLYNRFGMLRRFYEVLQPDGRGGWKGGDQYNQALALRVQSEAHGELREKFKALAREGADVKYGLCNTIHDSISVCYRKELRDGMVADISRLLSEPSKVLIHPTLAPGGLVFGVECSVGPNLAALEEIKLPSYTESCKIAAVAAPAVAVAAASSTATSREPTHAQL